MRKVSLDDSVYGFGLSLFALEELEQLHIGNVRQLLEVVEPITMVRAFLCADDIRREFLDLFEKFADPSQYAFINHPNPVSPLHIKDSMLTLPVTFLHVSPAIIKQLENDKITSLGQLSSLHLSELYDLCGSDQNFIDLLEQLYKSGQNTVNAEEPDFYRMSVDALAPYFSVRAMNVMHQNQILTIGKFMHTSDSAFLSMNNCGKKVISEIDEIRLKITNHEITFDVPDQIEMPAQMNPLLPISFLSLSKRSANALQAAGYQYIYELLPLTLKELSGIDKMGKRSASEVFNSVQDFLATEGINYTQVLRFYLQLSKAYPSTALSIWNRIQTSEKQISDGRLSKAVSDNIMFLLKNHDLVYTKEDILAIEASFLPAETVINQMHALQDEGKLIEENNRIRLRRPNVQDYIDSIQDKREKAVLEERLDGKTLEEIGNDLQITRERVRQIQKKTLTVKPLLEEDRYLDLFNRYLFSKEEFISAFDEKPVVYTYLRLCSEVKDIDKKELSLAIDDDSLSIETRRAVEKAVYRDFIAENGIRIPKKRPDIVEYLCRTRCQNDTKFSDFSNMYRQFLKMHGLDNDPHLVLYDRTYINIMSASNTILWKQWMTFRYYNIAEYDYTDLISILDLSQYNGLEITTLKLFRDNPELMKDYDLNDEYDLHDLLKKIWRQWGDGTDITFLRTPGLKIGKADRDKQITELMYAHAPVSNTDLANLCNELYGMKPATCMANNFKCIMPYFHNGIYDVPRKLLSEEQTAWMKENLKDDYYDLGEIQDIFLKQYPEDDPGKLNTYTLYTAGFRVYSSYAVSSRYPSAIAYIKDIFDQNDLLDSTKYKSGLIHTVLFQNYLYEQLNALNFVELESHRYMSIRLLNEKGVTKEKLKQYVHHVADRIREGEYFTIKSLYASGFTDPLDELHMGIRFYETIINSDHRVFASTRYAGVRIFAKAQSCSFNLFLIHYLQSVQTITLHELEQDLSNTYGIPVRKEKLVQRFKDAGLQYDRLTETVSI